MPLSYPGRWFSLDQAGDVDMGGLPHCGEAFGFAAARTRRTLPLMPPPADLECVAPLLLKIAQSQNRPDAPHRMGEVGWGGGLH